MNSDTTIRRAVHRLLSAVDRAIAAIDEARRARDEIARAGAKKTKPRRGKR
jgi:hypothetical protein